MQYGAKMGAIWARRYLRKTTVLLFFA